MNERNHAWGVPPEERNESWIMEQVESVLGRDAADEWMAEPNSHLAGRSPNELLDAGEIDLLHAYVIALLAGNYVKPHLLVGRRAQRGDHPAALGGA